MPIDAPVFCPWRTEAALPEPRSYFAVASSDDNVYLFGGYRFDVGNNNPIYYDTVFRGKIGVDGAIPAWSPQPPFETARAGLGAARIDQCLFVNGGSYLVNSTPTYADDTQYAIIATNGQIGAWMTSTNRLQIPRSNHTLLGVASKQGRYLYAIAGVTEIGQDTVHLDTIEVAPVGADCEVETWSIANYHLRGGRSSPQALVIRDHLVIIGGWGDLDLLDVFDDVQIAAIRADGSPSPWQVGLGRLPTGLYGHATSYYDPGESGSPVLFSVGGQPGTGVYGTWIAYAYVAPELALPDAIGPWRIAPSGQLEVGRAGHGIVTYRDRLYVIAGSAPGGQFTKDVISTRFDTGEPLH